MKLNLTLSWSQESGEWGLARGKILNDRSSWFQGFANYLVFLRYTTQYVTEEPAYDAPKFAWGTKRKKEKV